MKKVPIVFAFDNNLTFPACICIYSLLVNANPDTFYDIFILHSKNVVLDRSQLDLLPLYFKNFNIQYKEVSDIFDNAFEIRGVTAATYYRLLIPEIILDYDKVFYADVDIIFRLDLSDLYEIDLSEYYVAATLDLGMNVFAEYILKMKCFEVGKYLQAGFVLFNLKKMREDNLISRFKEEAKKKYKYQDQDILNIVCKDRIKYLPPCYNLNDQAILIMMTMKNKLPPSISDEDCLYALSNGNIHFSGHKPWQKYSINFDIWWEYYRKSPFFDQEYYFKFFWKKLTVLDQLSLWKRIKILIRFFKNGREK